MRTILLGLTLLLVTALVADVPVKANPVGCLANDSLCQTGNFCAVSACFEDQDCLSSGRWTVSGYGNSAPTTFWVTCGSTTIASCQSADRYHPCTSSGASASGSMGCWKDKADAEGSCWDPIDPTRVIPATLSSQVPDLSAIVS
ncbi:MAG: hypothetical protein QOE90_3538 [Thermoplasmata archaeon]|nr:hypothetical protein [Thermoplasmata archaeon]